MLSKTSQKFFNPKIQSTRDLKFDSQVLPQGVDIVFENINYSVNVEDKSVKRKIPFKKMYIKKEILKGVSGILKAGKVNVIMGASGAGKTTLLNILSCRLTPNPGGKLTANNLEYKYENFGNFASYVMQHDILMETLTVRETLEFAAKLKLDLPGNQRRAQIEKLAQQIKLEKCMDTLIGGAVVKGISGGQKKRLSIAIEILSDPKVIFLDEPTSGQDSLTSYIICSELKKLALQKNKTIIMTIHQPNSETFELFDELILMLEGRLIYHNEAIKITDYFSGNFNLVCPQYSNPPDFILSKIHQQNPQNVKRLPQFFDAYQREQKNRVANKIQRKLTNEVQLRQPNTGFGASLSALGQRSYINMRRNPVLVRSKIFKTITVGLFIGGMYYQLGAKNYLERQTQLMLYGLLFFVAIYNIVLSLVPVNVAFPLERDVVFKEQTSKMYSPLQYFLVYNMVQFPELVITTMISIIAFYFMIGLGLTGQQFFTAYLILLLISFNGAGFGMMLGSVIYDAKSGSALLMFVMYPMMLFSGYYKNRQDLPKWISWTEYLSPIKYGFISLLENERKYKPFNIQKLKFDIGMWPSIIVLFGLGVFVRIITYFLLIWMRKRLRE